MKLHLVYIPFSGVGIYNGYRGDVWFRERIEIFKRYTLQSLLNQSNKDFVVWLSFRSQEENKPLTQYLELILRESGLKYTLTFNGLMYWDDKFGGNVRERVWNMGRVIRDCYRNKRWEELLPSFSDIAFNNKNRTLEWRLDKAISVIQNKYRDVDNVYLTRIDSDDLFHRDVIQETESLDCKVYTYRQGYIYNADNGALAEYNPTANPPFHTIIFPSSVFFDPKKHIEYYEGYKSHEDIDKFKGVYINPERHFCVMTNATHNHISTVWNHPFRGRIIEENKDNILKEFGIN